MTSALYTDRYELTMLGSALRDGTAPRDLKGVASGATLARLTQDGDYKSWTERFLG